MDLELYGVSAVLLIIGLVQLAKGAGFNGKYGGILAVVLGVVASIGFTVWQDTAIFKAVIIGLGVGLSSAGLWSTTKHIKE